MLGVHKVLMRMHPDMVTIIVPRYPQHGREIAIVWFPRFFSFSFFFEISQYLCSFSCLVTLNMFHSSLSHLYRIVLEYDITSLS